VVAGRVATNPSCNVYSADFDEKHAFALGAPIEQLPAGWSRYLAAVCEVFAKKGYPVAPFEAVVLGDVPIGSGLSSSAALEVATAKLLEALFAWEIDPDQLALNCQAAEHRVGVNCGIMDQFAAVHAKPDAAILLDCRTLEIEYVPLPRDEIKLVICDTGVWHNLANTAYNRRRESCSKAVDALREFLPDIRALRDVSIEDFARYQDRLDPILRKRARHVITENQRVLDSIDALRANDLDAFGALLYQSHESLKTDYEVSGPELDALVEGARAHSGTYGARLVGAGFGGCTLNVIRPDTVDEFCTTVSEVYKRTFGGSPRIYPCNPAGGAKAEKA